MCLTCFLIHQVQDYTLAIRWAILLPTFSVDTNACRALMYFTPWVMMPMDFLRNNTLSKLASILL